MDQKMKTKECLVEQFRMYPDMQVQDVFKYLFQSSFGCEHMAASLERAVGYIEKEYKEGNFAAEDMTVNALDGAYGRVPLGVMKSGICAATFAKLFTLSAKKEEEGREALENKLSVARRLAEEGGIPVPVAEFDEAVSAWKEAGYPAIHHSDKFRELYHPAYRVLANEYISYLPLFAKIDRLLAGGRAVVAVEGGSASGKSTLGDMLQRVYDCTVFHMDDFFLRPEQRTPERFAEPGGNVDRERFLEEVLVPLHRGEPIEYRPFDCSKWTVAAEPVTVVPKQLVIVEGAYSMHPELADFYDFSVLLSISSEKQRERIIKRNTPQMAERFFKEWIPMEQVYFDKMKVRERCDMIIEV